jgi:2-haloacid dehalogenase
MRKIILMMPVSVDGFIEGPNRELDWQMIDEELHSHFNDLVGEAAANVGLQRELSDELASHYREIKPWPEVNDVLGKLRDAGVSLGVVTNCSETLGRTAIDRIAAQFRMVVTAERAGHYKPDPRPYETALEELGTTANRCLFVAGSIYDLFGTA